METTYFTGLPRADLNKKDFDDLIEQKGSDVLLETALNCPCKSKSTNQQSNCKNCGGTGWVFINPRQVRMVLTAINSVTEFRPWSEELRGTVNITSHEQDDLSEMDRITALKGKSIHSEVLYLKHLDEDPQNEVIFTYSTYNIKTIDYIALFISVDQPLWRLKETDDYTFVNNAITFNPDIELPFEDIENNNITIRYKHAPQFHVIEMKRDTMQSYKWTNQEVNQDMPVSAIARRAHYQLRAQNLAGDRLIDNSFEEEHKCD